MHYSFQTPPPSIFIWNKLPWVVQIKLYILQKIWWNKCYEWIVGYLGSLKCWQMLCFCFQGCDSQMSTSEMSCSESTSSCQSLAHGSAPEILIGLLYNATTGRLAAEVIKGSHFKNLAANRPPSEWIFFPFPNAYALGGISVVGTSILSFSLTQSNWNSAIIS